MSSPFFGGKLKFTQPLKFCFRLLISSSSDGKIQTLSIRSCGNFHSAPLTKCFCLNLELFQVHIKNFFYDVHIYFCNNWKVKQPSHEAFVNA